MSLVVDFPREAQRQDDFNRLQLALARMVRDDHAALVSLMADVLRVADANKPLTAAFACMTVAEKMLLKMPEMPFDLALCERFRGIAVEVAEAMALHESRTVGSSDSARTP